MTVRRRRTATSLQPMCTGIPVMATSGADVHDAGTNKPRGISSSGVLAPSLAGRRNTHSKTARRRAPRCLLADRESRLVQGLEPVVNVLTHAVLGETVALLDLAFELVTLAVDLGQIVVGELAPLLLDLARGL